ncbi:hypothetical protein MetexDRAFT_0090 [Methylorubrum extorquens DSM 13060]|jgi:hypothetical protein|uniref:Uncharacterized protein n=1 Tax=Methylorubrum extorquens DSM 13060 TaxID=882800 RepID=H1KBS8_METEX|nr:hypothetical protein MetexDRAFT_0090 [Methylorubrum extorquens DSM 13060]MCP1546182.1 hypothetical protein [Methylorubrum extorquens]MCP1590849.1 hypothetical protein [Methylorubrum extorquens]
MGGAKLILAEYGQASQVAKAIRLLPVTLQSSSPTMIGILATQRSKAV